METQHSPANCTTPNSSARPSLFPLFLRRLFSLGAFPLFLVFFFLIPVFSFSQNEHALLGILTDKESGEPLIYARIIEKGYQNGTFSDEKGRFSLDCHSLFPEIEVSSMGYKKEVFSLQIKGSDTLYLSLNPSPVQLGEVLIRDHQVELAFPDPEIYIFDYEFLGEYLLLTVHDAVLNRSKVVLVDDRDSIIATAMGPEPPGRLVRDCMGNIHVLSRNFACQIAFSGDQLLLDPFPLEEYEKIVEPCIGHLEGSLFYEGYAHNQHKIFVFYRGGDNKAQHLVHILNREKELQMAEEGFSISGPVTAASLLKDPRTDNPAFMFDAFFYNHTFFAKIFAPLHILGKQVLVFDHVNGNILKYDALGNENGRIPISYHKERRWKKAIYTDPIRKEAYTATLKNGYTLLNEIDLETGLITHEWDIPKPFVYKILIRNGVAYFLYKDAIYDDVKRLYKLQLK